MIVDVDFGYLAEAVSFRFLSCKISFFSPFSHNLLFGRKSLCNIHTEGVGTYAPSLLGGKYLHNSFIMLLQGNFVSSLLFINLRNHLFILVWTNSWTFIYTLGFNPILLYLFCSSFDQWELFTLAPVSLWLTPIFVGFFSPFFEHFHSSWYYNIL